jgi:hypothetical protein
MAHQEAQEQVAAQEHREQMALRAVQELQAHQVLLLFFQVVLGFLRVHQEQQMVMFILVVMIKK